jgi:hypothetical protein
MALPQGDQDSLLEANSLLTRGLRGVVGYMDSFYHAQVGSGPQPLGSSDHVVPAQ